MLTLAFVLASLLALGLHFTPTDPLAPLPVDDEPIELPEVRDADTTPVERPPAGPDREPSGPTLYGRAGLVMGALVALLVPSAAHADGLGSSVLIPTLLHLLLPYADHIMLAFVGAMVWGGGRLVGLIKSTRAKHYAMAVLNAGQVGAKFVEQAVAPKLRMPDGSLDPDGAAKAKSAAISAALTWLKTQGFSTLRLSLGMTDPALETALGIAVEVGVQDLPKVAPVPTPAEVVVAAQLSTDTIAAALTRMTDAAKAPGGAP